MARRAQAQNRTPLCVFTRRLSVCSAALSLATTLVSCASPARGVAPDAWAYKAYPGPRKDYKALSNVFLRNMYSKLYKLPPTYHDSRNYVISGYDVILTIDGDDGSRYSLWNGLWGGNDSSLGYLKMWIEPGTKAVSAVISMRAKNKKYIDFDYDFRAGYTYKFVCERLLDHARPVESPEEHGHSGHIQLRDFEIECSMNGYLHDGDERNPEIIDVVYEYAGAEDIFDLMENSEKKP